MHALQPITNPGQNQWLPGAISKPDHNQWLPGPFRKFMRSDSTIGHVKAQTSMSASCGAKRSVINTFFSESELGYTQIPVRPLGFPHLAPDGHMKSATHTSAQYLSPDWSWSAHIGFASVPVGLSVGHDPDASHFGTHASPSMPWI